MSRSNRTSPTGSTHGTKIGRFPAKESKVEAAVGVVRESVLPLVPVVLPLLDRLILPPLRRRQEEWFNRLGATLDNIDENLAKLGLTPESRITDEFIDLVVQASQAAARTHQAEKRELFLNALTNAALEPGDFQTRYLFLTLLEEFQLLHVKVLQLFSTPDNTVAKHQSDYSHPTSLDEIVAREFPDVTQILPVVLRDLELRSLVDANRVVMLSSISMQVKGGITDLGQAFLDFIRSREGN